jgi:hypothetical protein
VRKRILLWVSIGAAAATAWLVSPSLSSNQDRPVNIAAADAEGGAAIRVRWATLPERETMRTPAGEPFQPLSGTMAAVSAAAGSTAPPREKPAMPTLPYRIAGKIVHDDVEEIVLAKGDTLVAVREGDKLDGGYRVESIKPDHVMMLNVPLRVREKLPFGGRFIIDETFDDDVALMTPAATPSAPAADAPRAELRWIGPQEVKAGQTFSVALTVASSQPLGVAPFQLTYNARLLEPVAIRAGAAFGAGVFSHQIDPPGAISVTLADKTTDAADVEIFVATFRPLQAGDIAEVSVSSMYLRGAAGGAITHNQAPAFRTTIVQ